MPAAKPHELDLSLIDPGVATAPTDDTERLYREELKTYASADEESDEQYERRARRAFLSRELKQIDDIVASRKNYANKIFCLVVGWLIGLAAVVLLAGWKFEGFELDSKVLLALIGGTTLNVLGIFTIVTNFLFPKNGHSILSRGEAIGVTKTGAKTPKRSRPAASPPSVEATE